MRCRLLTVLPIVFLISLLTPVAHADTISDATELTNMINAERASHGLAILPTDPRLVALAESWSRHMAASNVIGHNPNLRQQLPDGACTTPTPHPRDCGAENVGVGPDGITMTQLHDAFVASPHHETNIVGPYSALGVGVAYGNGKVWVTEDFVYLPPRPPRPAPTTTTTAPRAPNAAVPVETDPHFTG